MRPLPAVLAAGLIASAGTATKAIAHDAYSWFGCELVVQSNLIREIAPLDLDPDPRVYVGVISPGVLAVANDTSFDLKDLKITCSIQINSARYGDEIAASQTWEPLQPNVDGSADTIQFTADPGDRVFVCASVEFGSVKSQTGKVTVTLDADDLVEGIQCAEADATESPKSPESICPPPHWALGRACDGSAYYLVCGGTEDCGGGVLCDPECAVDPVPDRSRRESRPTRSTGADAVSR